MKIEAPKTIAAGIPAIEKSMEFAWTEAGLVRGTVSLLKLNQKDGFDCPGCAWPDPDHRSITEFCENGAKAVAEETTTERATPSPIPWFCVKAPLIMSPSNGMQPFN